MISNDSRKAIYDKLLEIYGNVAYNNNKSSDDMPHISYKLSNTTNQNESNILNSQLEISIVSNQYNFELLGNYGDTYINSLDKETLTYNNIYVRISLDNKQEVEIDEVIKNLVLTFNVKIL